MTIIVVKGDESMDNTALTIAIIGAINWGLVGIFTFDLVAWIFGSSTAVLSRIVYTLIALAGVWCVTMLFKENDELTESHA